MLINKLCPTIEELTLKKDGKDNINKELTKFFNFQIPHLNSLHLINLSELVLKDYIKTVISLSLR